MAKGQPPKGTAAAPLSAQTQAHILAEALPHMQRYDRQTVVIKFGGHAMGDGALAAAFAGSVTTQVSAADRWHHGGGGWHGTRCGWSQA